MQAFVTDISGRLLISKDVLIENKIYTSDSYRTQKSKKRLTEVTNNGAPYVFADSLTPQTRDKVKRVFSNIKGEYAALLRTIDNSGEDCVPVAIQFTAESLHINESFIRSAIETHINGHYPAYTWAYLDAGLHSDSVKGYAKQCALVQWISDFVRNIKENEPNAKRSEVLLRSFRMNLLTALNNIEFEIKIPRSDTRFNKWFDDIMKQMDKGQKPEDIIQIKRQNNSNAGKISDDQFLIAKYFYTNGTNMSVATVYKKWLTYGKEHGWWLENGIYNPPTEARLYQLLAPLKNPLSLEKTDAVTHRLSKIPTATRLLPEKKNHVWVIDGTAHNENVDYGNVRQHIYAIKVADVATLRLVGATTLIGVKEPFDAVRDAILMGICETGYKPAIIQCDRGPAWKELESWCEDNDIRLYPSITGNARAKTIESLFNMFDNDITRYLKGYSGQNRTAAGINSRSSEKRETKGKQNARSASIAMEWITNEGMRAWNERVIETLERKPCNKTPFQMWEEKESFVPELSYVQLCQMCGTLHERKLTIEGLEIGHKAESYLYFPPIETSEQRAIADRIFTYTPLDANTTNKLKIYILNGGDPAPVFSHDGKYLGVWTLKTNTSYTAAFGGSKEEKEALNNISALQYRVGRTAKEINEEIQQSISMHPDFENIEKLGNEMLTGKRRPYDGFESAAKKWCGRYDKSALLQDEVDAKVTDLPEPQQKRKFKTLVDPDTGEYLEVEIN